MRRYHTIGAKYPIISQLATVDERLTHKLLLVTTSIALSMALLPANAFGKSEQPDRQWQVKYEFLKRRFNAALI